MAAHPLRREIIVTQVVNNLVNFAGITFFHRLSQETSRERRGDRASPLRLPRGLRRERPDQSDRRARQHHRCVRADRHAALGPHPDRARVPVAGQQPPTTDRLRGDRRALRHRHPEGHAGAARDPHRCPGGGVREPVRGAAWLGRRGRPGARDRRAPAGVRRPRGRRDLQAGRDRRAATQCPPASTWAKASASPPTRRATSSSIMRSGETRLFEFDQTGAFVKEFGVGSYGFAFAHAVRVDKDDNVWAVDEGTNVIQKFSPDGKLLMVLGKRPDPLDQLALTPGGGQYSGANRPYTFHRQTDIGWDPQGNIFVSDGYGDSRVVKFDKNGRFIKAVGTRGNGPLQFSTPHAISVDAQGHGLRRRSRQLAHRRARQRPEPEGGLRQRRRAVGGVHLGRAAPVSLQLELVPDRQQLRPGARPPARSTRWSSTARCSAGSARPGTAFKEFSSIHQMDCRNPDELYVAEITAWRVQKIILRPQPAQTSARQVGGDHEAHHFCLSSRPRRWPSAPRSSRSRCRRSTTTPTPTSSRCRRTAKWPASRPTRRATSSSTRAPATPSRRSATSARSITAARGCFSSIRPASS